MCCCVFCSFVSPFESEYINVVHKCARMPLLVSMKGKRNLLHFKSQKKEKNENYVRDHVWLHAHFSFTRCSYISCYLFGRIKNDQKQKEKQHINIHSVKQRKKSNSKKCIVVYRNREAIRLIDRYHFSVWKLNKNDCTLHIVDQSVMVDHPG